MFGFLKKKNPALEQEVQEQEELALQEEEFDLDEIMKNEFIDGYIIGANDLSGSINELGNALGENTTALVKEAIAKLKANGKYVGLSTGSMDPEVFRHWFDLGVDMLSAAADFDFLTVGMNKNRENLRNVLKEL